MKRKKQTKDYERMAPIKVYNLVRSGKLKKFPNNYLDKEKIKDIVRQVILVEYGYSREEIISKANHAFFVKNYIGGFRKRFEVSDAKLIAYCFPEMDIKPWEYNKRVSDHFWKDKNNQKAFLLWVAEKENLDLSKREDLKRISAQVIKRYGANKLLKATGGIFPLLNVIANNKYKEWEISSPNHWTKEKAVQAIKWMTEEKMNLSLEEMCFLKVKDFKDYNLDGMLQKVFNHSILNALNGAYPNSFVRISRNYIKVSS